MAAVSASALLFLFHFVLLLSCSFSSYARKEAEKTLAMIKPDGVLTGESYTGRIKTKFLESGFSVVEDMIYQFDVGHATQFFAKHSGKSFFPRLIKHISSGPVIVMVLEKPNAVAHLRVLIGPTDPQVAKISHPDSVRAMCGSDIERNCIHASDSLEAATTEIAFFFGDAFSGNSETLPQDELKRL